MVVTWIVFAIVAICAGVVMGNLLADFLIKSIEDKDSNERSD